MEKARQFWYARMWRVSPGHALRAIKRLEEQSQLLGVSFGFGTVRRVAMQQLEDGLERCLNERETVS